MENLKLTLTFTKNGEDKAVGIELKKDFNKEDYLNATETLVKCVQRSLEVEKILN